MGLHVCMYAFFHIRSTNACWRCGEREKGGERGEPSLTHAHAYRQAHVCHGPTHMHVRSHMLPAPLRSRKSRTQSRSMDTRPCRQQHAHPHAHPHAHTHTYNAQTYTHMCLHVHVSPPACSALHPRPLRLPATRKRELPPSAAPPTKHAGQPAAAPTGRTHAPHPNRPHPRSPPTSRPCGQ